MQNMSYHLHVIQLFLLFARATAQCGSGTYIQPTCIDNPNFLISERDDD